MAAPSRAAFRAALADLSAGERARFVADLSRARGWTARVESGDAEPAVVLARDGRRRRLLVHDRWLPIGARVPDDVDAVVTPRSGRPRGVPGDVAVVDGDALYERTVHGIDAADRERLFERLGGPPLEEEPDAGGARRRAHLVLAVVALAVVATAVAGVPGPGTPGGDGEKTGEGSDGSVGTPTPFVGSSTTPASTAVPADAYPPGVNASGLVDAGALVTAHADALKGRSYRVVMTYAEYEPSSGWPGEPPAARRTRLARRGLVATRRFVARVGPSRVRTSVTADGNGYGIADPVPRFEVYAETGRLYRRIPRSGGTLYRRIPLDDAAVYRIGYRSGHVVFGGAYLGRALRVDASRLVGTSVRNGTRLFELRIAGDSDPRTGNVTGRFVVDERGVVRSFARGYAANATLVDAPANVTVAVRLQYDLADVAVEPPGWLAQAREALGENDSAFVPAGREGENRTDADSRSPTGLVGERRRLPTERGARGARPDRGTATPVQLRSGAAA